MEKEFGHERILDTPISEILIAGAATGAAMTGMRPIADVQYGDFLFCMMDQLADETAKMRYMSGGKITVPMVMRAPIGATTRGAQHAQSLEGFFTHIPGLKVICPSNAYDAVGLLRTAVHDDDPVIMFEHKMLYGSKGNRAEKGALSPIGDVPEAYYTVPFGQAAVRREGSDVTVVANLLMVYKSMQAAEILAQEGISCEVIDPRTLVPFDYETVIASVKKTSRLAIVHEDVQRNGWGAEVAAEIAGRAIYYLDAPIKRICTYNVPIPFAPVMENYVVPSVERIVQDIKDLMQE